jgi:hypothetical protein
MTWWAVWVRAQLTAVVASAMVWLVMSALVPLFVAGFFLLGVVAVAGWSTRPMLWWRYGARPLRPAVAEAVWRRLVPVESLRGRNQPRLWVGDRVDADMVAASRHQLVLSERLVWQVSDHRISDREMCWLAVRAFGLVEVNRSPLVAGVAVFCAPWALVAIVASALVGRLGSVRLVGFAWRVRWLFFVLAAIDLYGRGYWVALVMLGLVAAATVTTPRWNRAWTARQTAMTETSQQTDAGTRNNLGAGPFVARPQHRPISPRGGAR